MMTLDEELLLAHILGVDRAYLRAHDIKLTPAQQTQYNELLQRLKNGEPLAYLIGKKEFWSMELDVTPDTLIPRPDTETLVETILQLIPNEPVNVADLGTGSGAIALALAHERPKWQIFATDISESALNIARKNAQRFSLMNISFHLGNWCTALPCKEFTIIAANPPYISETEWEVYGEGLRYEPRRALVAESDGMAALAKIAEQSNAYLLPGGYLVMEHGFMQGEAARAVLALNGYTNIQTVTDLSTNERLSYGQKSD